MLHENGQPSESSEVAEIPTVATFVFADDIRAAVLDAIPYEEKAADELAAMSPSDLLIVYFNWLNRHIAPRPRRVHQSRELKTTSKHLDPDRQAALHKVLKDIRHGKNLSRYLSKRVLTAYVPNSERHPELRKRPNLDLLLNGWGVHHLHVSKELGRDGFVVRSVSLLFVAFTATDAYVLDVMTHEDFHRRRILEIMVRTWPKAGLTMGSISGARLTRQHSEEEGKELREAGVSMFEEIDGRIVMARDSVTTAGTSIQATRRANDVMHKLGALEEELRADPAALQRRLPDHVAFPKDPEWKFVISGWEVGLLEQQTRAMLLV